jgi:hypothetical protein
MLEDWWPDGFYTHHVWNSQGPMGRPKGGVTCLFKAWLNLLKILHKDENLLIAKTTVIVLLARIH